jgi:Cobalt uptake substrate-specific transmembrane region
MLCLWKLREQLGERTTALMSTMAAFVFAAQMVNFPLIPLPISGHLLEGVLSAVKEGEPLFKAPIPDYQLSLPGSTHVKLAVALAGAVGTLVFFAVAFCLARHSR